MSKVSQYSLEEAINVMENMTRLGKPFSVKFKKITGGNSIIPQASMRPMATTEKDSMGAYKLQLIAKHDDSFKSCYIPLLMEVNNIKIAI